MPEQMMQRRRSAGVNKRGNPERTQLAILDAALVEFAENGFGGGRIEVIAANAGVNKQALYYHFESKDGLFAATLEHAYKIARSFDAQDEHAGMTPVERLKLLVSSFFDNMRRNQHIVALVSEENRLRGRHLSARQFAAEINGPFVSRVRDIYEQGVQDGMFRPGIDPRQLWITIVSVSQFYFSNIYTMSGVLDRELTSEASIRERKEHITDFIISGLMWRGAEAAERDQARPASISSSRRQD